MKYRVYGITLLPYDEGITDEYGIKEVTSEEKIKQYCQDLERKNNEKRNKKNHSALKEHIHYKKVED